VRILVTGAGGFVGTHLLAELSGQGGHEITAGAFGGAGVPASPDASGVRWVALDVTSDDSVAAVLRETRPERVYHLAGQASVGESFRSPHQTWEINATGTLRLLDALRVGGLRDTRVLLTSSAEVYGAVPAEAQPIAETHPLRPLTPYGASKAAAEMLALQSALSSTAEVVVARSFNQIGPGQDERFVLPSFARQLVSIRRGRAEPVLHVGNLEVWRDFLDVRDAVRGYLAIMEHGENGSAYNVSSGSALSLAEVVAELVRLSGTNARVEIDPERFRPVDIPTLMGDSSRLRGLGWTPRVPLATTLADLLSDAETRAPADG
jgi:GDP-4-dehydro-6-deoxy-D-mannose reductase